MVALSLGRGGSGLLFVWLCELQGQWHLQPSIMHEDIVFRNGAGVVFITSFKLFIQAQKKGTLEMVEVPARANHSLVQRLFLLCLSIRKPKHMLDVSRGVHNVSYLFKVCFEATTYKFVS